MATDSEKICAYATRTNACGIPAGATGVGEACDPTCNDVLRIGLEVNERQVVVTAGYTITEGACLPSRACAAATVELALGKPVLAAYTVDAEQIGALVSDDEGLDESHVHCALMAELALKRAVTVYAARFRKS